MLPTLILLAQAATPPPPPPPPPPTRPAPMRIDLTAPTARTKCRSDEPDTVVVCGGRDNPYRLRPLPPQTRGPPIPKAETTLFGDVRAAVETEQANVGGFTSNRAMFRLKMPF